MPEQASVGALGVFGGTFDPVHFGHLRLAEEAIDRLGLAAVRWIPAGQPVHRATPQAAAVHRLAMVRQAIAGNDRFELDASEIESAAPSYTVLTLERLRKLDDRRALVLLVGADAFAGISDWYRWEDLFDLAHIAVAHRPGFSIDTEQLSPALAKIYRQRQSASSAVFAETSAGRIVPFTITQLAISATQIRTLLALGCSPRYLLPDALIAYIQNTRLYSPQ